MEIVINIPEWMAYILVVLLALYAADKVLGIIERILEWRIKRLRNKIDQQRLKKINAMPIEPKYTEEIPEPPGGFVSIHTDSLALLSEWLVKDRHEGQEHYKKLRKLDDIFTNTYKENRISMSFVDATKLAYIKVINTISLNEV